jgi:5,10-methylenetetrahydromethanopterin reductase
LAPEPSLESRGGPGPTSLARYGCYLLPGSSSDPAQALHEASVAASLQLGSVWIAEKYGSKDLPALSGAIGVLNDNLQIGAAVTHIGVRHPLVIASMGQTLQELTHGRFCLGFGRSSPKRWDAYGVPAPTLAGLSDMAGILRGLWAGDTVRYDGVLGRYPKLRLASQSHSNPPPVLLAGVGPRTLAAGGEAFDGVILHPFLTVDAVSRSAELARDAHEHSERAATPFRVIAAVVVVSETADEARRQQILTSRAARYFSDVGLGEALTQQNRWDTAVLQELRRRGADGPPVPQLEESAALGSAAECAAKLRQYLSVGVDEIILHGSTVAELRTVVSCLAKDE